MSAHDRYYLEKQQSGWCVRFNGKVLASFQTRSEALKAAVEAVQGSVASGVQAEVLAPDENGALYSVWTSDRDGYTPPQP